jgi:nucleotidyltransferase substrate binding protein (TIGR01987 family)
MSQSDIRWTQRLQNYRRALARLVAAVGLSKQRPLSDLEQQGLVQAFEFTHELAWNTLKDFMESRGVANLYGSRDVTREAFALGLIENGEVWMGMIRNRNLSTHTYNEETVKQIVAAITGGDVVAFIGLEVKLAELEKSEGSR